MIRRARAHAALGAGAECHRDLAAAETTLLTGASDPSPGWCRWMSTEDLAADSSQCHLDLGRTNEARASIDEGLSLPQPSGRPRVP